MEVLKEQRSDQTIESLFDPSLQERLEMIVKGTTG
jgi:hypothetical protein